MPMTRDQLQTAATEARKASISRVMWGAMWAYMCHLSVGLWGWTWAATLAAGVALACGGMAAFMGLLRVYLYRESLRRPRWDASEGGS